MTSFIIVAALISIAALGLLIWPLKRTRNTFSYERQEQNIHFAKERLQELEAQLKNASISATDYEALKLEIESTLAQDIDLAKQKEESREEFPRRSNKVMISLLSVCLPIAAVGFYLITGTPEAIQSTQLAQQQTQGQNQGQPNAEQVKAMVESIEQRLRENPNDLEGWQVISRTYLALGRYPDAQQAYLKVLELGGESAETYASLADATALKSRGEITEEATGYLTKALALNPNNRQALWLMGLGAIQKDNKAEARLHWGRLVPLLAEVPQQQQELREIIAESLGDSAITSEPAPQSNSATAGSPSQGLRVNISLSPEMAQLASANDFVFVFARALNGPPAPLAVKRLRVADLPTTVILSDADAMMPQFKLSLFENVKVSARVSKSGQPTASPGDLQSQAIEVKNNTTQAIDAKISSVVE